MDQLKERVRERRAQIDRVKREEGEVRGESRKTKEANFKVEMELRREIFKQATLDL